MNWRIDYDGETQELINDPVELELNFQKNWHEKNWDGIWESVYLACRNVLKKIQIGHYRRDFNEIVMDATITQINRMKNKLQVQPDYEIGSLVNYVYLGAYFTLRNPKRKFEDSIEQIGDWNENIGIFA